MSLLSSLLLDRLHHCNCFVQVYEMPDSLSSDCQALLRRLLHPDPALRIKMEGVLRDPWFLTGGFADVFCL
jgi:hypothetical protein